MEFEWTGSDDATGNLLYSYKLEGHEFSWSSWTSATSKSFNDLSNGGYTFKVKAKDEAGNEDTTPATRSFTVEIRPLKANFTYKPEAPIVKEIITFNDSSDGYIVNWTWNFDDGTISYEKNPTHSYEKIGIYNVTLTVTDDDNDTYSVRITIKEKEDGGIPGFEFAFLIIAIASIILFKCIEQTNF